MEYSAHTVSYRKECRYASSLDISIKSFDFNEEGKELKKLIRKTLNWLGYDLVRHVPVLDGNLNLNENLGYDLEEEAVESILVIKNHTMLSKRRLVTLYQQAVYCEKSNIPGAFVECGVWKGGAVGLMALANKKHSGQLRHIHLFDAFQEICEPDAAVDGKRAVDEVRQFTGKADRVSGRLSPLKGIYDHMGGPGTLEECRKLLETTINYNEHYLHYHQGWFQDTLPMVHETIGDIAILRLDGDWYASTKVCLAFLFDKVVVGGVVIIDDYGTYEGCKKAVDEYLAQHSLSVFLSNIDSTGRYFIKTA